MLNIKAHKVKPGITRISSIKNIIAVTSGKGGVGKSTVAVNLAIALQLQGAKVGILDCDIYGPSLPLLVGEVNFKPEVEDKKFVPLKKFNLNIMSFGFLIAAKQPAIWRGAIVLKALDQMLHDTIWGDIDILILDMPPGTGDIHLTMAQKVPITATIAVTTPQDIALIDVIKSIEMFNKLSIPCLGIIENMAYYICEQCNHQSHVFGQGGSNKLADQYNYSILAQLPLDSNIRKCSDAGSPIVLQEQQVAKLYNLIAEKVIENLTKFPLDYSSSLANINITKK
jgi:ATP-binding protein involved in chromosome partitioning